jgi:hypothetical protein
MAAENLIGFIPPQGGYENLVSFQKAGNVYDGTVKFCERFLDKRDRTCDQMVQLPHPSNDYLPNQQIRQLEKTFPKEGGPGCRA